MFICLCHFGFHTELRRPKLRGVDKHRFNGTHKAKLPFGKKLLLHTSFISKHKIFFQTLKTALSNPESQVLPNLIFKNLLSCDPAWIIPVLKVFNTAECSDSAIHQKHLGICINSQRPGIIIWLSNPEYVGTEVKKTEVF